MSAVAEAVGIARPHLSAMRQPSASAVADDHRCRMPSWSPTSAGSSPICRPMAIAAFMLCCAARREEPGAQRPIRNASTAS